MENKVALRGLEQIRHNLEDDSLNAQLLITCQMDAMDLIKDLFGEESGHYKTIRDAAKFSMGVQQKLLLEELDLIINELKDITAIESSKASQIIVDKPFSSGKNEVFIVHGRDTDVKEDVAYFLKELGFKPIILHEQPNAGRTIIEKFEYHSSVEYAVVLLTPDDIGGLKSEPNKQSLRARQNVIFEMGCFFGKLGRRNVCALVSPGVEQPSDLDGIVYITLDKEDEWKRLLARELEATGLNLKGWTDPRIEMMAESCYKDAINFAPGRIEEKTWIDLDEKEKKPYRLQAKNILEKTGEV
jgi:predicted nucleotide-binding protein